MEKIYSQMAAVTAELGRVKKNINLSSYKAVSEGDILAAVKPVEEKNGIYSYPESREVVHQSIDNGRYIIRIKTKYTFVSLEDGSKLSVEAYGDGIDTMDKGPGKAMTYADKYCLMKAYKIETGDDPDYQESPKSSSTQQDEFSFLWNSIPEAEQQRYTQWMKKNWNKEMSDLNQDQKNIICSFIRKNRK